MSESGETRPLVLVVDDEPALRSIMARSLEVCVVLTAGDAFAALELIAAAGRRLSLAVVDLQLPTTGGRELVTALRHWQPGLAVLFVSGHPDEDQGGTLDDPLLMKPFSPDLFAQRVREILVRAAEASPRESIDGQGAA
ncbi:MAG: response regulator [Gemmatimonadales bacterium]